MKIKTLAMAAVATAVLAAPATARDEIRIVGSSTVFPFATKVAQEFKNKTGQTVVIESTGSGGGHKLFCAGVGTEHPDVTNSSRRQKKKEFDKCQKAGVTDIVEVKVGSDGIVMANAIGGPKMELSLEQVFLAFAAQIPASKDNCTLVPNPNTKWSDISKDLPNSKIEAFGPPPTSGTRDAFVEIAMEKGAKKFPCLKELRGTKVKGESVAQWHEKLKGLVPNLSVADVTKGDKPLKGKSVFKKIAHTIREDGAWVDAGENDNAIVQTLVRSPSAVGIFGFSFLDQNSDKIKGAALDGVLPSFEAVSDGSYPVARSLYFYIKKQHVGVVPGIQEYAQEFMNVGAIPGGYLEEIGLIPLAADELKSFQDAVNDLTTYEQ